MSYNLITANLTICPLSAVTGIFFTEKDEHPVYVNLHFSNYKTREAIIKNTEQDGGSKVYSITGELVTLPEAPFLQIRYATVNETPVEEQDIILDGYISRVYKNHEESNLILSPRYGQDSRVIKHYGNDRTLRVFWKKDQFDPKCFENIVSKRMKFKVFREGTKIYIKEILQ